MATRLALTTYLRFQFYMCPPLGAVEKKDSTYRIILDLSSPKGQAVNDGIDQADYSVRYSSFDDAVDLVHSLGPGSTMAEIDIKHAFRLCPVRPQDYQLLGMCWNGKYYIDTRLPFGSRSSPFIFNSFADAPREDPDFLSVVFHTFYTI